MLFIFFFKQKTAYEMRISDWSSDVCSSDLADDRAALLDSFAMPEMAIGTIGRLIRRDLSKLSLDTLLSEIEPGEGGPVVTGAYKNMMGRSEGRRVGKEGVSTCRSRGSRVHEKKKKRKRQSRNKTTKNN